MAERWEREERMTKRIAAALISLCGEDNVQPSRTFIHFQSEDGQGWSVSMMSPSRIRLAGPGLGDVQGFENMKELMTYLYEKFGKPGGSHNQQTDLPSDSSL